MHMVDDQKGIDISNDEQLEPVVHMINFKTRRALMCRGDNAKADASARGFKRVTAAHFVKYIADAKKGFRSKGSRKR